MNFKSQFFSCHTVVSACYAQITRLYSYTRIFIHSFIHSLVFSLRCRVGRNQSPVMWPVWLWHNASWANSWG